MTAAMRLVEILPVERPEVRALNVRPGNIEMAVAKGAEFGNFASEDAMPQRGLAAQPRAE